MIVSLDSFSSKKDAIYSTIDEIDNVNKVLNPLTEKGEKGGLKMLKKIIDNIMHNEGDYWKKSKEMLGLTESLEEDSIDGKEVGGFVFTISKSEVQEIDFAKSFFAESGEPETVVESNHLNSCYPILCNKLVSSCEYSNEIDERITRKILNGEDLFEDQSLGNLFGKNF